MKVWIVEGATGEYEDRRNWVVKAFVSKERAESLEVKLNGVLMENRLHYSNMQTKSDYRIPDKLWQLDPGVSVDYTGADYDFHSIEVEE